MSKFMDFLNKAFVDDAAKKEIETILGDKKLVDATDEQLAKVSNVAKNLGVDITAEEMKEFASGGVELHDEELEAVAGGLTTKEEFEDNYAPFWAPMIYYISIYVPFAAQDPFHGGCSYEQGVEIAAKKFGLETDELYRIIKICKNMGVTEYKGFDLVCVYEGLGL